MTWRKNAIARSKEGEGDWWLVVVVVVGGGWIKGVFHSPSLSAICMRALCEIEFRLRAAFALQHA